MDISSGLSELRELLLRRLPDDVMMDAGLTGVRIGRRSHVHQALTELIGRYSIVCNQQQVGPDNAAPLGCDLSMDQTVVDSR